MPLADNRLVADAYMPNKPGFAFNAGGPVWGLDWCPQADDELPAGKQGMSIFYLAGPPDHS